MTDYQIDKRFAAIHILTCISLAIIMLISSNVWTQNRSYDAMHTFFAIDKRWAEILFWTLITLLILAIIKPLRFISIFPTIIILFALMQNDQQLWQPYIIMYCFTIIALMSGYITKCPANSLTGLHIMLAGIYIYSGIQKFNLHFLTNIFPWFASGISDNELFIGTMFFVGTAIPFFECSIGVLLITKKYRKFGIICSGLMHGFALLSLGPLGHNWNIAVWPWNISMFMMVLIICQNNGNKLTAIFQKSFIIFLSIAFFLCLPILNFFRVYDHYAAFSLYSGVIDSGKINFKSQNNINKLPSIINKNIGKEIYTVEITKWLEDEVNMMPLPEARYYRHITSSLCKRYNLDNIDLEITYNPRFGQPHSIQETFCIK